MPEQLYSTIITDMGTAKIAEAIQSGNPYIIIEAAVGDGNGSYYIPTPAQTELRGEVWRGEIAACEIDQTSPNMLNVKLIIPPDAGGWTVREAGLFDIDGGMLAVCNLPDTQKAIYSTGTTGKLTIIMHIVVTDAGVLEFEIHPELDGVSREELSTAITLHDASPTAHSDLRAQIDLTVQSAIANFYTKPETDELVGDAVYKHDVDADAHGDVRAGVAGLDSRVSALEVVVGSDIGTAAFCAAEDFASASHAHNATDISSGTLSSEQLPTVPVTKGGTGATTAAAARTNLGAVTDLGAAITLPAASGWVSDSTAGHYPYYVTVSAPGVRADTAGAPFNLDICRAYAPTDKTTDAAYQEAWNCVRSIAQGAGTLTFYAETAPSSAVPLNWKAVE